MEITAAQMEKFALYYTIPIRTTPCSPTGTSPCNHGSRQPDSGSRFQPLSPGHPPRHFLTSPSRRLLNDHLARECMLKRLSLEKKFLRVRFVSRNERYAAFRAR